MNQRISAILISLSAIIFSCKNAGDSKNESAETENASSSQSVITGKWKYEKMEKYAEGTNPGDTAAMEQSNQGLTVIFGEDGQYYSLKETASGTDSLDNGRYEIINNGKDLVTIRSSSATGDTVKILELTATTLKVETPRKEILVIKKIQ